jgi:hypothetical protein
MFLSPYITARGSPYLSEKNTGLGNVLFQIASTYGLAKKTGRIAIWNNVNEYGNTLKTRFGFNHKDTIFRHFMSKTEGLVFEGKCLNDGYGKYDETLYPFLKLSDKNIVIVGYLENTKYFDEYKDEIKQLFSPDEDSLKTIKLTYPILFDSSYTTIGIHFRGNEYLHLEGKPKFDYLKRIILHLKATISNPVFLIFSDDMDEFDFSVLDDTYYIKMGSKEDYIDLWAFSLCKHAILSHSTFAFWGAYLNKNEGMFYIGYSLRREFHKSLNIREL